MCSNEERIEFIKAIDNIPIIKKTAVSINDTEITSFESYLMEIEFPVKDKRLSRNNHHGKEKAKNKKFKSHNYRIYNRRDKNSDLYDCSVREIRNFFRSIPEDDLLYEVDDISCCFFRADVEQKNRYMELVNDIHRLYENGILITSEDLFDYMMCEYEWSKRAQEI